MTLQEAINLSKVAAEDMALQDMPRFAEAVRLGREALKFRQRWEQQEGDDDFPRLPGETDEQTTTPGR